MNKPSPSAPPAIYAGIDVSNWIADLLSEEGIGLKLAPAKYLEAISYARQSPMRR